MQSGYVCGFVMSPVSVVKGLVKSHYVDMSEGSCYPWYRPMYRRKSLLFAECET